MAEDLDTQVEAFRTRSLADAGEFTFVAADALTMRVREEGRVINAVALVATGVHGDEPEVSTARQSAVEPAGGQ